MSIRKRKNQKEAGNIRMRLTYHSVAGFHRGKMCFGALHRFMDTTIDNTKDYGHHTRHHTGVLLTHQKYFSYWHHRPWRHHRLKRHHKNGFHYWHHTGSKDWRAFSLNDSTDILYLFKTESVEFFSTYSFTINF